MLHCRDNGATGLIVCRLYTGGCSAAVLLPPAYLVLIAIRLSWANHSGGEICGPFGQFHSFQRESRKNGFFGRLETQTAEKSTFGKRRAHLSS